MSPPWLPRAPAFAGFYPAEIAWQPVIGDAAESLQQQTGLYGSVATLAGEGWSKGFFKIAASPVAFVKQVSIADAQRFKQADVLAAQLEVCGIAVSRLMPGFPKPAGSAAEALLAYPFIDANFLNANSQSLQTLGQVLAKVHHCWLESPSQAAVKSAGTARFERLQQALIDRIWRRYAVPAEAEAVLEAYPAEYFAYLMTDAQMVHGDVNVGNVLQRADGELVLLDFESALSAWLNPRVDLAFVIERFILVRGYGADELSQRLSALLQGYYAGSEHRFNDARHLVILLQTMAVRSLLILTQLSAQQKSVALSEWHKFVELYRLAATEERSLQITLG
ncbi:hypothetical protein THMIRHAS_08960 [Thiosulfatimonas sediminis]|uniref:Aminoglycoside phosphotransferase domain-containing protein n=1 Tax=Thiosulfatimonas sediminis TaxID=2675054 RepID=A0A6F8PTQ7_9GAMM|nr:phosphotransferase [Thiosulfatimonas sediminis]BBP45523.1 hypothetical protein THMIRHAS_08960 [Thiosulfatimonas sediminis]